MKAVFILLTSLIGFNAFAMDAVEAGKVGLETLIASNPLATFVDDPAMSDSVAALFAQSIEISGPDKDGRLYKSSATNDCTVNSAGNWECILSLLHVTVVSEGSVDEDITESSTVIFYIVTPDAKVLVGDVTYQIAG